MKKWYYVAVDEQHGAATATKPCNSPADALHELKKTCEGNTVALLISIDTTTFDMMSEVELLQLED